MESVIDFVLSFGSLFLAASVLLLILLSFVLALTAIGNFAFSIFEKEETPQERALERSRKRLKQRSSQSGDDLLTTAVQSQLTDQILSDANSIINHINLP